MSTHSLFFQLATHNSDSLPRLFSLRPTFSSMERDLEFFPATFIANLPSEAEELFRMHFFALLQVEFKKMSDKVGFRVPKDFIYLNRTLFGIGMILFKLRVNLNFYNEIESYLFA